MSEWISVKDRLPESSKEVLVWYEYFRYGEYNRLYQTFKELNEYLFSNVSEYSTHLEEQLCGEIKPRKYYVHTEITSETYSKDMYGEKTAFSSEFTRLLKKWCLR